MPHPQRTRWTRFWRRTWPPHPGHVTANRNRSRHAARSISTKRRGSRPNSLQTLLNSRPCALAFGTRWWTIACATSWSATCSCSTGVPSVSRREERRITFFEGVNEPSVRIILRDTSIPGMAPSGASDLNVSWIRRRASKGAGVVGSVSPGNAS